MINRWAENKLNAKFNLTMIERKMPPFGILYKGFGYEFYKDVDFFNFLISGGFCMFFPCDENF